MVCFCEYYFLLDLASYRFVTFNSPLLYMYSLDLRPVVLSNLLYLYFVCNYVDFQPIVRINLDTEVE